MSVENYKYRVVNLNSKNKDLYSTWTLRLTTRASMAMEKLVNDGWELASTTHDLFGNPRVLTFRKNNATNSV
jgi:hypothetical protein